MSLTVYPISTSLRPSPLTVEQGGADVNLGCLQLEGTSPSGSGNNGQLYLPLDVSHLPPAKFCRGRGLCSSPSEQEVLRFYGVQLSLLVENGGQAFAPPSRFILHLPTPGLSAQGGSDFKLSHHSLRILPHRAFQRILAGIGLRSWVSVTMVPRGESSCCEPLAQICRTYLSFQLELLEILAVCLSPVRSSFENIHLGVLERWLSG